MCGRARRYDVEAERVPCAVGVKRRSAVLVLIGQLGDGDRLLAAAPFPRQVAGLAATEIDCPRPIGLGDHAVGLRLVALVLSAVPDSVILSMVVSSRSKCTSHPSTNAGTSA